MLSSVEIWYEDWFWIFDVKVMGLLVRSVKSSKNKQRKLVPGTRQISGSTEFVQYANGFEGTKLIWCTVFITQFKFLRGWISQFNSNKIFDYFCIDDENKKKKHELKKILQYRMCEYASIFRLNYHQSTWNTQKQIMFIVFLLKFEIKNILCVLYDLISVLFAHGA